MEAKTLQNIFIKILRAELSEATLDTEIREQLTPGVISALYELSKRHDLAHIVAASLQKNGLLTDDQVSAKFKQENAQAVYRHLQMEYAYKQICDVFEEKGIPYIPLKGAVLRQYYPQPSMRTSCDIDILIREENLECAVDALTQKGFQCGERHYHDISLRSPRNIHLELHFHIQENTDNLDAVLKDVWQYAKPMTGSCYGLTKEFFLFYMFAHMSYHFLAGGCGIRPLMDIWVIEHKMGIAYPQAEELLQRAGIYTFARGITELAEACFSGQEKDAFSDTLLSYIFDGGVYGSVRNRVAVKKGDSTLRYVMQRLFMPYENMTIIYPILEKCPFLLPICWIMRIFKMLFGGKLRASAFELRIAKEMSNTELEKIKQIKEGLGL